MQGYAQSLPLGVFEREGACDSAAKCCRYDLCGGWKVLASPVLFCFLVRGS
ncbi:hypothetical protein ACFPRL_02260 [Pseudoclavibacter helvolus]